MKTKSQAVEILHERTAIYTRDPVVERLLDLLPWPNGSRRLIEPSCGDGAFLLAALHRLLRDRPQLTPLEVPDLLVGYEVHPGAAEEARGRVAAALLAHGWPPPDAAGAARRIVLTRDFLTDGPDEPCADFVAGNPPYLRYAGVPEELRAGYHAAVPAFAIRDLLHAFLERCARILRPGGEIGFVTADRWLMNEGAADLRRHLGTSLALHVAQRIDARSAFYRPKRRRAGTPPRVHPVIVRLAPPTAGSCTLTERAFFPDAGAETPSSQCLGDVASVRLAPWLGRDGIFIVDGEAASKLPADSLVPIVDTEEVRGGALRNLTRYAIRTRPDVQPPPAVLDHLRATVHLMAPRGRRDPFWLPPETWHNWDLTKETLVVPRITRDLHCIRVPAGVLPVNHSLSIITSGRASLDDLEHYINGPEARRWIRARAQGVDNGYISITTRLLRELPIPDHVVEVDDG
jgi:tRNA1(Val) A37 N6-methylase TrmN6